jgi:RNA polymerase sigma-70 factor (ECF subfamily)
MTEFDERQLAAGVASGEREACERFLDAYESRVYNLCRRMVGDEDAEDVAQDALVEILNSIGGFGGRSKLLTWVHRVAVNVCLEHRRKKRPQFVPIEEDCGETLIDPGDGPAAVAIRNEVRGEVEAAIGSLAEIHRDVVVLHELQGLTYHECAEVLGCPVGTVKSRIANAFVRLRELLRDYEAIR